MYNTQFRVQGSGFMLKTLKTEARNVQQLLGPHLAEVRKAPSRFRPLLQDLRNLKRTDLVVAVFKAIQQEGN